MIQSLLSTRLHFSTAAWIKCLCRLNCTVCTDCTDCTVAPPFLLTRNGDSSYLCKPPSWLSTKWGHSCELEVKGIPVCSMGYLCVSPGQASCPVPSQGTLEHLPKACESATGSMVRPLTNTRRTAILESESGWCWAPSYCVVPGFYIYLDDLLLCEQNQWPQNCTFASPGFSLQAPSQMPPTELSVQVGHQENNSSSSRHRLYSCPSFSSPQETKNIQPGSSTILLGWATNECL